MNAHPNPFGLYIRKMRQRAGVSLRALGAALGVSHVFAGEVERGERPPYRKEHWPALIACLPEISEAELARQLALAQGVVLRIADASPAYQELALALACADAQTLRQEDVAPLLALLRRQPPRGESPRRTPM